MPVFSTGACGLVVDASEDRVGGAHTTGATQERRRMRRNSDCDAVVHRRAQTSPRCLGARAVARDMAVADSGRHEKVTLRRRWLQ